MVAGSGIAAEAAAPTVKSWSSAEAEAERQALLAHAFDQLTPLHARQHRRPQDLRPGDAAAAD